MHRLRTRSNTHPFAPLEHPRIDLSEELQQSARSSRDRLIAALAVLDEVAEEVRAAQREAEKNGIEKYKTPASPIPKPGQWSFRPRIEIDPVGKSASELVGMLNSKVHKFKFEGSRKQPRDRRGKAKPDQVGSGQA